MSSSPTAGLHLRLANGLAGATLAFAAITSWLQPLPAGSAAHQVAQTALAPPRWGHILWYAWASLQALCALHQAVGAGYKFDGRKALLVNSAGFAWAAQALSQACAVLLARQPGCARVHQVWMCMAPPMALLIASLTSGIICLARMSPILQRMQEMEIKKDDNKSKPSSNSGKGHAAKSLFPQQAMSAPKPPVAEAVVTKSKGDPLGVITSGEVDAASASWLYAAPVSGMVAWTALSIGAYFVACVTPSVKNDNSIEGLCAAFAIIATVVVLLVMHAYKEAMGSGTLMLMMLFIAADGHPILWMPRMLCGALGFMLTMRLAAYCMPDD